MRGFFLCKIVGLTRKVYYELFALDLAFGKLAISFCGDNLSKTGHNKILKKYEHFNTVMYDFGVFFCFIRVKQFYRIPW